MGTSDFVGDGHSDHKLSLPPQEVRGHVPNNGASIQGTWILKDLNFDITFSDLVEEKHSRFIAS
jgi:hypothetical protein